MIKQSMKEIPRPRPRQEIMIKIKQREEMMMKIKMRQELMMKMKIAMLEDDILIFILFMMF